MNLKINHKVLAVMGAFFMVPLIMFLATVSGTSQQRDDGLVINQAGRQRMLIQKMSKECLTYVHQISIGDKDGIKNSKKSLQNTMLIFATTLNSLIYSGPSPLTLDMNGKKSNLPAAVGQGADQLRQVKGQWTPFKEALARVLNDNREDDVNFILANNIPLLTSMNKAVGILQKQAEGKVSKLFAIQAFLIVVGIAIVAAALFLTNRHLIRPIRACVDFAGKLAAGDLTQSIEVGQKDELGELATALNEMSRQLSSMIGEIGGSVSTLASSAGVMSNISDELAQGSELTVSKANTVAAAAEEMNVNMDSVAAAMEEASTNVKIVAASTQEMNESIGSVARHTEKAKEITDSAVVQAGRSSEQVNKLGDAAEEIGAVTETIRSISDKTNLLALNATIEAARAGDAGKGFAVVANEIKELAKQTAKATEDIAAKLQSIQSSTAITVTGIEEVANVIDQVAEIVSAITESVQQQRDTTSEISENVNQTALGLTEINENVSQSSQAAGQVAQEITDVNEGANEISNSSAQVRHNASELIDLAETLRGMVQRFNV